MTLEQHQRVALRLANQTWCRWWAHLNHPQEPQVMAICCVALEEREGVLEASPGRVYAGDMRRLGYRREVGRDGLEYWKAERTGG